MIIQTSLRPNDLVPNIERLFELSASKILSLERSWKPAKGAPVITRKGVYTARGWTEWTEGFRVGSALLQFDATGEKRFLGIGRSATVRVMASHVSHTGVHDHGFTTGSTCGNLLRLMGERRIPYNEWERRSYELAIKVSGAVQAARWTACADGLGYIYSFNGPHSLFADTMRSLRVLALAHGLGHSLLGEQDRKVNLLGRLLMHAETTARYNVYFGRGRDAYDRDPGRVAHESIFNSVNGSYRCPGTQQGYSPFSTWMRGLAWILLGYSELLEFLETLPEGEFRSAGAASKRSVLGRFLETAEAAGDFYIRHTPADGIPYWDTGAPGLLELGDYLSVPSDPFNEHEPVDSSAAAIAAQGLLRLGHYLIWKKAPRRAGRFWQAGLTVLRTITEAPYLSERPAHQGLILHSVYHRPNGWDYIPRGSSIPSGESSMWGDYHAREAALYVLRIAKRKNYPVFFSPLEEMK
jgi:unsaturated chondroitin disaccharide hydrolase